MGASWAVPECTLDHSPSSAPSSSRQGSLRRISFHAGEHGSDRPGLAHRGERACAGPGTVLAASKGGILKNPGAIISKDSPMAPAPRRHAVWQCRRRHTAARVSFNKTVRVEEFKRTLGCHNVVPQDGSTIPIALGSWVRSSTTQLCKRKGGGAFEDRCYIRARMRCRLLRKAMGNKRFAAAWVQCKREIRSTLKSRELAKQDPQTKRFEFMPETTREARERALALARELRLSRSKPRISRQVLQKAGLGAARARVAKRAASKVAEWPCLSSAAANKRRPLVEQALKGGA